MFSLFRSQPLIEPDATAWLHDCFSWCFSEFDSSFFAQHTTLVIPDDQFFPGRAQSAEGLAALILHHVKRHAGVAHWPTTVLDRRLCAIPEAVALPALTTLRQPPVAPSEGDVVASELLPLPFPFISDQLSKPEAIIATFAHMVAHYLGQYAKTPPPGGQESWGYATEVVAIFMGFGLMFANSAFTHRGGCGSCYNPAAERQAQLSELEATYALALFARLKKIPISKVKPYL
ncbi:MAG: hypothetical protein HQL49_12095, partial [Gammaproteobacteria bacterium]|nr:hypothetical protein [Gammaproteobacteria bacterium]